MLRIAVIPPFLAHVVSQMIGFFPALWMLIMWDFVCINAGLRPVLAESANVRETQWPFAMG
jgi:hypothetical protein